jgi:hypothetical protein
MNSTGGQRSRVSSRDQCDANSLRHWGRRMTGCFPSGRSGNESRGAIIPSTTERCRVCLTARYPGEKRRDRASAICFAKDGIHSDESWSPISSSTFLKRRSSLIMGRLNATNASVTCTTLELSTQSLNKDIPSFFTRSTSVPMSTIRIALSSLTEMHSSLSFHSYIPWSCHCPGSPRLPATSSVPPNPTSASSVCIIPLLGAVELGVHLSRCSPISSTSAGSLSTDDSTGSDSHSLILGFPWALWSCRRTDYWCRSEQRAFPVTMRRIHHRTIVTCPSKPPASLVEPAAG